MFSFKNGVATPKTNRKLLFRFKSKINKIKRGNTLKNKVSYFSGERSFSESDAQLTAMFISGLCVDIRNQVELTHVHFLDEAIDRASTVEYQLTTLGSAVSYYSVGNAIVAKEPTQGVGSKSVVAGQTNLVVVSAKKPAGPAGGGQQNANPYAKNYGTKCFKCGEV